VEIVLWVALGVALALAEIFTTTLFLLMFAGGAFAAALAAALGAGVPVQAAVFVAVSAVTVVALRPMIKRRLDAEAAGDDAIASGPIGMAALEGAAVQVVEQVDEGHGLVKIDGELWQARSLEGTYAPGERVRVVRVTGATVVVWHDGLPPS
jgi:membrane protein implicated in regulation of membrane protease activity